MAFDEVTATAMREVARYEKRITELEAALRRIQCETGCTVEAHKIIEQVIGTPWKPIAGVDASLNGQEKSHG